MATKKYQVFVSSTFRDLVDERQDTIRNILDLNHIPAGMELFPAADVEQLDYIKKVIDECDYYLLIVGGRYGSLDAEGISFTEREYDYAVDTGKFVIAFVHGEPSSISFGNSDTKQELIASLNSFREKVMTGRLVRTWNNRQDLELIVLKSLMHAFSAYPQTGWIRADNASSEQLLEQTNKALQENADLRAELMTLKAVPKAKIENLADLDDLASIRYKVRHSATSSRASYYTDHSVQLRWQQIFAALANNLQVPKTDEVIGVAVADAMREANHQAKVFSVNTTDRGKIKVQMIALGLIESAIHKSTNGGVAEFLSLTDDGRSRYVDMTVTRKSD